MQRRLLGLAGSMGFLMYGLGYSVPLVRRDLGVSRSLASIHQITFATLLLLSSLFLARFISRFNPTIAMRLGWVVVMVGICIYTWGPNIWVTVPGYSLCAVGATLFNNTNAATLGQVKGSSLKLMLRTTGVATAFGALAPTIIGALTGRGISWRLVLLAMGLIVGFISLRTVPTVPDRTPVSKSNRNRVDKEFSLMMGLGLFANFLEVGAGAWALDLLISRHMSNSAALVLATLMSFGVAGSRLGYSLRARLGATAIWLISTALTAIGLGIIIVTHSGPITVVGLIVASFGIGPLGGIALAFAADSYKGADLGISANVVGAAISIGSGPWLIGFVSDGYGFPAAYTLCEGFLLVATVIFFMVRRDRKTADQ